MRYFNTAGPINPEKHYCLSPLNRINLEEILYLIEQEKYFVLHAPRQTGKTSSLLALMEYLNKENKFKCLYINVEGAQAARENIQQGMKAIIQELALRAKIYLNDNFIETILPKMFDETAYISVLNQALTEWCPTLSVPLVLLIDEIDALVGDTLISVLRQIRSGYDRRPVNFPQSIILCGVRDVRDYRIHSDKEKAIITGGSAFNIKAKSLRLGNFVHSEVDALLEEHTKETGQKFDFKAKDLIWEYTQGQPWLVNALAYEVSFDMKGGRDRTKSITEAMVIQAKENLILRRETHLDQLADKLREERVQNVISPMMEGKYIEKINPDDIQYVIDLGLIKKDNSELKISNPIYREVIPRELTIITQYNLASKIKSSWYISPDGSLDMLKLLKAFQEFFREHSEHWVERFEYKEAGPQLLIQAFLQRVVNSGGRIEREYGLGRGRTDLMVIWPYPKGIQKEVIELKILYKSLEKTISAGLEQTYDYMDRVGRDEGHLVIFDRSVSKTWEEKIFCRKDIYKNKNKTITVWGM
ncbi:MAG: ATP-binding protein [Desulfobacterales bacterium]|nr:ATP-binding protein [Desulfobacterales bacterium]